MTSPSEGSLMLIDAIEGGEIRVAVLEGGDLDQFQFEVPGRSSLINNIYVGRVVNVEPSLGAAFVDIGADRNGFLHESDVVPGSLDRGVSGDRNEGSRGKQGSIRTLLRKGQAVVVQVTRDAIGKKGPTLTTNLSLPGRYLVVMPYLGRLGVSRKIPDVEERKRLKSLLADLDPPPGLGCIVRTAGLDRTKGELHKDLRYLLNLWAVVSKRIEAAAAPSAIYQESDLVIRAIRDFFTPEITRVLVDSEPVHRKCREFVQAVMPRYRRRVELYSGRRPLFEEFGVEFQIERTYRRRLELPSGGSVVIEPTEALVAVDVNSGKSREQEDLEGTAYRTNLEAIPVLVRQIRLRDLGGLIVIDFIDMQDERHKRSIEREMRAALKKDRARTRISSMTEFGVIEITRQRMRAGAATVHFETCPQCGGTGRVKGMDSRVGQILRQIRGALARDPAAGIEVALHPSVGDALLNRRRRELVALEEEFGRPVGILADARLRLDDCRIREAPPPPAPSEG